MAIRKENWINPLHCEVEYLIQYAGEMKKVPEVVVNAIMRKFRTGDSYDKQAFNRVMAELNYSGLNGCYFFTHAGMFHGVEESDGYIHT